MSEEAKRLNKDLLNDPAPAEKVKTILETGTAEEQAKAINGLGCGIGTEDIRRSDLEPVDDEEMEAVAGGKFFFGENAADGHEIGCAFSPTWYVNQDEADQKCCPKSPEFKHDYDRKLLPIEDRRGEVYKRQALYDVCKYCGYKMLVE